MKLGRKVEVERRVNVFRITGFARLTPDHGWTGINLHGPVTQWEEVSKVCEWWLTEVSDEHIQHLVYGAAAPEKGSQQ